jgi:hypothetical protein
MHINIMCDIDPDDCHATMGCITTKNPAFDYEVINLSDWSVPAPTHLMHSITCGGETLYLYIPIDHQRLVHSSHRPTKPLVKISESLDGWAGQKLQRTLLLLGYTNFFRNFYVSTKDQYEVWLCNS